MERELCGKPMPLAGKECGRGKRHKGNCLTPEAAVASAARNTAWRATRRMEARAYDATYRAAHRGKRRAYCAAYDADHPAEKYDRNQRANARRRARRITAQFEQDISGITERIAVG